MAGPTSTARQALVDVLEPVWPGRVWPYRPTQPRPNAGIYVGELAAGWAVAGAEDLDVWSGTFAVRLVADGANDAAQALLDDLIDQTYRAVARSEDFYPDGVVWDPFDIDAVSVLPAYTFGVRCELDVVTWCDVDEPVAVTIPPHPIGA